MINIIFYCYYYYYCHFWYLLPIKSQGLEMPILLDCERPHQLLSLQGPSEMSQFAPPVLLSPAQLTLAPEKPHS